MEWINISESDSRYPTVGVVYSKALGVKSHFTMDYVHKMASMLVTHIHRPWNFTVYSHEDLLEEVKKYYPTTELKTSLRGWMSKLEVFHQHANAFFYLDLDTVICRDLTEIFTLRESYVFLDDFNWPGVPATGLMYLNTNHPFQEMYKAVGENAEHIQNHYHGDGVFILEWMRTHHIPFEHGNRFQLNFPGIISYTHRYMSQNPWIVCSHGKTKPHTLLRISDTFYKKYWEAV